MGTPDRNPAGLDPAGLDPAGLDPGGELRALASDCVHCGFCLPACPTYQLWGEEMDSPRGRIHLITQLLDGAVGTAAAATHLDRCLGCMACVPACPSGVRYDRLIEAAREWAEPPARREAGSPGRSRGAEPTQTESAAAEPGETGAPDTEGIVTGIADERLAGTGTDPAQSDSAQTDSAQGGPAQGGPAQGGLAQDGLAQDGLAQGGLAQGDPAQAGLAQAGSAQSGQARTGPVLPPRSRRERALRRAIFETFPYPARLRALTAPLRIAQRTGADRMLDRSRLASRVAPELTAALRVAPAGGGGRAVGRLPERIDAQGERRAVVGMLLGCVQQVFFPQVNAATARVLALEGCDVVVPRGQGCCGALSLHGGRRAEAVAFARRTIETFEQAGVDTIVVNAAGCGSSMKEYGQLLAGDPDWAGRAAALSERVRDLSEFLAALGPAAARHPLPLTVVYQDACHLGNAQRITRQPRDLLAGIPGLRVAETGDGATCCGSAGIYNLVQPAAAGQLGARKASAVWGAGADVLVSSNPGCAMQIAAALRDQGTPMPVAHIAEVLDASLRGRPASVLLDG